MINSNVFKSWANIIIVQFCDPFNLLNVIKAVEV